LVPRDLLHIPNSRKIFNVRMKFIFGEKSLSSLFRILRQELTTVFPAMYIVLPQQKVRKIDHLRCTCVLVVSKDVERFSVYLLLVSFWHCRPLAASQVTGRKDLKVPHKFAQPLITRFRIFWCLVQTPKTCSFARSIKTVWHVDRSLLGYCGQFRRSL